MQPCECQIAHSTKIYITKKPAPYSWNHFGKDNHIVVVDTLLCKYWILVCIYHLERSPSKDLGCVKIRNMYIDINWVSWPELMSKGGNTSSHSQVLPFILFRVGTHTILNLIVSNHWCRRKYRIYRKVSNIRRTLVGNKIVDHSDVVGASPVGAAPTTSSFST